MPPTKKTTRAFICVQPFRGQGSDKGRYVFAQGDLVLESHPIRPARSPNFEEVSKHLEEREASREQARNRRARQRVEQATAAPGEVRDTEPPSTSDDPSDKA